jgi:hypothetical protein
MPRNAPKTIPAIVRSAFRPGRSVEISLAAPAQMTRIRKTNPAEDVMLRRNGFAHEGVIARSTAAFRPARVIGQCNPSTDDALAA